MQENSNTERQTNTVACIVFNDVVALLLIWLFCQMNLNIFCEIYSLEYG